VPKATDDPFSHQPLTDDPGGLNDHVCRFESQTGAGFGIYEVASGF